MKQLLCAILVSASALTTSAALADRIAGHDDPQFTEAVQSWLDGRDLNALEALASLSRDGNTAAQILLANIASRGHMHTHVTTNMPRQKRVELLRIPKDLSGKSWLTEAQATEPLAVAILQSSKTEVKAPAVAALFELGEPMRALLAARSLLFQGKAKELIEVLEGLDPNLPDEAVVLLLWARSQSGLSAGDRYVGSARVESFDLQSSYFLAQDFAWTPPGPRQIVEDPKLQEIMSQVATDVESWTQIKKFCSANCSKSINSCIVVGASTMFSAGPFAMRSPAESLISNADYWNSPRAEGDLARQMYDVSLWSGGNAFTEINTCFFDHMEKLQDKHGHAKH